MRTFPQFLLLMAMSGAAYAAAASHPTPSPANVRGSGCVERPSENACRLIIDSQSGELYSLQFPAKTPRSGTAIQFSGTTKPGANACGTGKPVKVKQWKKEKGIKCPPPVMAEVGR